jgi:hypothetical protein
MSTRYRADEYAEIAKRVKELESETSQRINGISLEDAKPVEAPADIDWTGMYGYPAGYTVRSGYTVIGHTDDPEPTNAELFKAFRDFIG